MASRAALPAGGGMGGREAEQKRAYGRGRRLSSLYYVPLKLGGGGGRLAVSSIATTMANATYIASCPTAYW